MNRPGETRPTISGRCDRGTARNGSCGTASERTDLRTELGNRLGRGLRSHGGDLARRHPDRVGAASAGFVGNRAHLVDERERRILESRSRGGDGRRLQRHCRQPVDLGQPHRNELRLYSAIVIGDPSTSSCATSVPSDALSTAATWGPAITGNVTVLGTAPEFAGSSGTALIDDAISYVLSGSGTGLYVSLNCEYASASSNTAVPLLAHVEGGGFTVQGKSTTCPNAGAANTLVTLADSQFSKLASSWTWSSPACSVEETFDAWPNALSGLGYDAGATPSDFTAADGVSGQPYVLVGSPPSSATLALSPSTGGEVPQGANYGSSNPAAAGYSQDRAFVADAIDPATGDFTESDTDLSIPTYGPALNFTRSYDAELAQQEISTGTPGPLGYGWSDNWSSSLSLGAPAAGDIYTIAGLRTDDDGGGSPTNAPVVPDDVYVDSSGNVYIADTAGNRIEEIPATTGTHWGISMTAGDIYTVAGSATGAEGHSGDGGPATSALLDIPGSVAVDGDGDLIIADTGDNQHPDGGGRDDHAL